MAIATRLLRSWLRSWSQDALSPVGRCSTQTPRGVLEDGFDKSHMGVADRHGDLEVLLTNYAHRNFAIFGWSDRNLGETWNVPSFGETWIARSSTRQIMLKSLVAVTRSRGNRLASHQSWIDFT